MLQCGGKLPIRVKILTTRILEPEAGTVPATHQVTLEGLKDDAYLRVVCGDGSVLGITELQQIGRKPVSARAFANGLQGQPLVWVIVPLEQDSTGRLESG
jgi:hypothetical protein